MISGDFAASSAASASTVASSSATGTTRCTKPMRAPSSADTRRPVIIRSSAVLGGIDRSSGTVIMYGHKPDVDLGGAEHGIVGRDHEIARAREAEAAGERVAAHPRHDRLSERPHVAEQVGEQAPALVRGRGARVLGDAGEIGARAEGLVEARRLLVEDGRLAGVLAAAARGAASFVTDRAVIATGGIGGLFDRSTNPGGCFGQGLALAAGAGAALADLEFIQFHPTALAGISAPRASRQRSRARRRGGARRRERPSLPSRRAGRRARAARRGGARRLAAPGRRP